MQQRGVQNHGNRREYTVHRVAGLLCSCYIYTWTSLPPHTVDGLLAYVHTIYIIIIYMGQLATTHWASLPPHTGPAFCGLLCLMLVWMFTPHIGPGLCKLLSSISVMTLLTYHSSCVRGHIVALYNHTDH